MNSGVPDLIFVSMENWDEIWRRNQFLCALFTRENPERKMLFVGLSKDVSHSVRKGRWAQLLSSPSYALPDFPRITVLHPLKLLPNSWGPGRRINEFLARWQIRREARRLALKAPLLWLNPHAAVHMAGRLGECAVIYDVTDDWTEFAQDSEEARLTREQDAELCARADAVIVCSERLRELKAACAAQLYLIPNGVDAAHYRRVLDGAGPLPALAAEWKHPIIGYTGSIHPERVDLSLLENLAAAMPEATFVLIGPVMLPPAELARLAPFANVILTGALPYQELPEYMRAFDVCIVPHRVTPFTESLNPIKLWEYLAAGKPIVSTRVAGFRDYPQWVRLASGSAEFAAAIHGSLTEAPELREARRTEAAHHSWESRWSDVKGVIQSCLSAARPDNVVPVNLVRSGVRESLYRLLRADAKLLTREFRRPWQRVIVALGNSGMQAVFFYRLSHWFAQRGIRFVPALLNRIAQHVYAVDISPHARIGPGLVLVHCFGIVVGDEVEIDGDCIIYHGVTLGNRGSEWVGSERTDGHPHIAAGCMFGAGAKVLGPIVVGRNCVVGANSVVLIDVPPCSVAAGVPARVVGERPGMDANLRPIHRGSVAETEVARV